MCIKTFVYRGLVESKPNIDIGPAKSQDNNIRGGIATEELQKSWVLTVDGKC